MLYTPIDIESSYARNDLGRTLYDLVLALKPKTIVEFGALEGYSTIAMAMALDELGRGKIHSYDLWQSYEYKHTSMGTAMWNVMSRGLGKYVQFYYGDYRYADVPKFDLMHFDVSNDGKKIREMYARFKGQGTIVFEGGSKDRDKVAWMSRYRRKPIAQCGLPYKIIEPKFPSISIIQ